MGRNPKIRVSYNDDAQFFIRLSKALEGDKTRPVRWRRKMIGKLNDLAGEFLKAPPQDVK